MSSAPIEGISTEGMSPQEIALAHPDCRVAWGGVYRLNDDGSHTCIEMHSIEAVQTLANTWAFLGGFRTVELEGIQPIRLYLKDAANPFEGMTFTGLE